MIPEIEVSPLFEAIGPSARDSFLRIFRLHESEQRKLWKKNFAPENPNLYRGWFPLESGEPRPGTVIAPLPLGGVVPFEPFQFGDHL